MDNENTSSIENIENDSQASPNACTPIPSPDASEDIESSHGSVASEVSVASETKKKSVKSKVIWSFIFVAIAALTIWAVTSQEGFSFSQFVAFMGDMHPGWLTCAFLGMAGFIVFEALAIMTIIKSFGFKRPLRKGIIYSTSDIYFSAITPSASGGQPASAYFMMRDGISGSMTTVSLIVNLVMYSFAIVIIGIISILLKPSVFLGFPVACKVLILVGAVLLIGVALFFLLLLYKSQILLNMGNGCIKLLSKLRLIKKPEALQTKLNSAIEEYRSHVAHLKGKGWMLVRALVFNVLQRASLISVTLFVYLAAGNDPSLSVDVWVSQCLVIVGTNMIPIPGAMGISDYMLISAFAAISFTEAAALNLNLASRGISFYLSVILCGLSMVIRIISYKVGARLQENKQEKNIANQSDSTENDSIAENSINNLETSTSER